MGLFRRNKKKKLITFYALTNFPTIEQMSKIDQPIIFTITSTFEDCIYYMDEYLYHKHFDHFNLWCDYKNNPNVDKNDYKKHYWREYKETVLNNELEELFICETLYDRDKLASILRMFNNCIPLDCPFITDFEFDNFFSKIPVETINEVEQQIKQHKNIIN